MLPKILDGLRKPDRLRPLLGAWMVQTPALILCLALGAVYLFAPDEETAPLIPETRVSGVEWTRHNEAGKVLSMQMESVTRQADGKVVMETVQIQVEHGDSNIILRGEQGFSDDNYQAVTLAAAGGEIEAEGLVATLTLQTAFYRLREQTLSGRQVRIIQQDRTFHGDRFMLSANGGIVMEGNVRAVF